MDFIINNWWLIIVIAIIILTVLKTLSIFKKPGKNIQEFIDEGAVIIDVRTESEFNSGNIKNSINVPLKDLIYRVKEFDKDKKYVTVCAVGMRAESAKKFFENRGYNVVNGGRWSTLKDLRNNT